jgi:hypothetical protein
MAARDTDNFGDNLQTVSFQCVSRTYREISAPSDARTMIAKDTRHRK